MPRQKIPGQSRIRGEVVGRELLQLLALLRKQGLKWNIGDTLKSELGEMTIVKVLGGPGKSGMGVVYIVLNEAETDVYAVKTFQPKFFDSPEAVSSFKREALVWIELARHANIVRAYFVEEIENQPFIFMEFIAGSDLREKIGIPLSPEEILKYSIHFCRGMMHASEKIPSFIHRDVKPENCLITQDGTLKVTDFGLAKSAEVSSAAPVVSKVEAVNQFSAVFKTQSGRRAVGTLPYMAPELFREGGEVDVGVDIYAFGMMLYEMLTGRLPFYPPSTEEWIYVHLHTTPPHPRKVYPRALRKLANLSMRCLSKRRQKRPSDFAEIHSLLEKLLRKNFNTKIAQIRQKELDADDLLMKGFSLETLGRTVHAILCYDKAIELNPKLADAYGNRGNVRANNGDLNGAIADYDKAIEINPNLAEAYYNRGNAHYKKGNLNGAIEDFEEFLRLEPDTPQASAERQFITYLYNNRGAASAANGDLDGAIADFNKAIRIKPNFAEAYHNRGLARGQKDDLDGAIVDYTKAIQIEPKFAQAYSSRGVAHSDKGDLDGAIGDYNKAIQINPNYAGAYNSRGLARADNGDLDGAIADFNRAIEINSKDDKVYYNRGNARYEDGDIDSAIADYTRAIEINPNNVDAYINRGNARADKAVYYLSPGIRVCGDLDGAIADYNKAIEIDPKIVEAYSNRGFTYYQKGDYDSAIADYEKAIEIDPKYAQAYTNRGAVRRDKGDLDGAIEDFEEFLRLAPGHPQASKVSQVIVELNDAILKIESDLANRIVAKLNAIAKPDEVTKAVELLLTRIIGAGNSLAVLRNKAPHDFAFDGAMILRGIYDAMLQALYILNDPAELEQRAQLYLDYYWIEKREAIRRIDKNPTSIANRIKNSPKRPKAGPKLEKRFDQVKSHFPNRKGKLRSHWYAGDLRRLAQEVGLESEYEILQKHLSGAVHSSPMTLKDGPLYRDFDLLDFAWRFSFRVLGKFAEFKGAILSKDEKEIVRDSFINIYDYGTSN